MNGIILWLMGNTIFLCGLFQLIPFLHSLSQGYDGVTGAFAASILLALLFGSILLGRWQQGWTAKYSFNILDGAAFMFVCWWMLSIFGSLPYYFSEDISFIEAVFEGVSCFTTTGIGNLAGEVNPSLVLWRSISQWLGGYVVLFLICTILPGTSGIFGTVFAMPGNMRTGAITLKRIKNTGIRLFNIYVVASLLVMVLYALGGMGFFEAINMGLVTISTGGCYVPEAEIQGWLILPMFLCAVLAGGNTLLYFQGDNKKWQRLFREILLSTEVRVFGAMLGIFTISIAMHLYLQGMYNGKDSLINALFHVLSFACTTGVMIDSMLHWGDLEKFLLLILVLIGGCIGSLGGGFKLFRLMVLFKSFLAELKRTLHPNMIPRILIDGNHCN